MLAGISSTILCHHETLLVTHRMILHVFLHLQLINFVRVDVSAEYFDVIVGKPIDKCMLFAFG